jgi:hypothetical protein
MINRETVSTEENRFIETVGSPKQGDISRKPQC